MIGIALRWRCARAFGRVEEVPFLAYLGLTPWANFYSAPDGARAPVGQASQDLAGLGSQDVLAFTASAVSSECRHTKSWRPLLA